MPVANRRQGWEARLLHHFLRPQYTIGKPTEAAVRQRPIPLEPLRLRQVVVRAAAVSVAVSVAARAASKVAAGLAAAASKVAAASKAAGSAVAASAGGPLVPAVLGWAFPLALLPRSQADRPAGGRPRVAFPAVLLRPTRLAPEHPAALAKPLGNSDRTTPLLRNLVRALNARSNRIATSG